MLREITIQSLLSLYKCEHCSRCCRRERVTVTPNDIKLNRKFSKAIESHLVMGYSTFKLPCPFINDSNKCTTYINRPLACKRYPIFEKYPGMVSISSCPYGDQIIKDLMEYSKLNGIPTENEDKKKSIEKWDQLYRNMGVGQKESFDAVSMPMIVFEQFLVWIMNEKRMCK